MRSRRRREERPASQLRAAPPRATPDPGKAAPLLTRTPGHAVPTRAYQPRHDASTTAAALRASVRASSRSVFAFASVVERSCVYWRPRHGSPARCNSATILSAPVVASSATTSLGDQTLPANSSNESTRVAIRPADRTSPSLRDRDLAEIAVHVQPKRPHHSPLVEDRERGGRHDSDGYVLSAHPGKSQGRPRTTSSSQLISQNGLPIRASHQQPLSRENNPPDEAGRSFMPGQRQRLHLERSTRSPAADCRSDTCAPAPTGHRRTGKPNASSAPCSPAGPTAPIYGSSQNAPPPLTAGSSTTDESQVLDAWRLLCESGVGAGDPRAKAQGVGLCPAALLGRLTARGCAPRCLHESGGNSRPSRATQNTIQVSSARRSNGDGSSSNQ